MKKVLGCFSMGLLTMGMLTGTAVAENVTTIDFWYYTADTQAGKLLEQVERFQEENPDIVVNVQSVPFSDIKKQLSIGVAADQLPDVTQCDVCDTASFAAMGAAVDITAELSEWDDLEQFYEGPLDSATYEGKYYGIPLYSNCLAIMYNKDIFDEMNIAYPESGWTWDEFKQLVYDTTTEDHYGFTTCLAKSEEGVFNTMPFVWATGADYDSMDSEGAIEALTMLGDFYQKDCMSKELLSMSQFDMCSSLFSTGKSAMMVGGSWLVTNIASENPDLNLGVVTFPVKEKSASAFGGSNLVMMKDENKEASLRFMQYIMSKDNSLEFCEDAGFISPRKDSLDSEGSIWNTDAIQKIYKEQFATAQARGPHPNWPEISGAIQVAIQDVMLGTQTAEEACIQAAAEIAEIEMEQ